MANNAMGVTECVTDFCRGSERRFASKACVELGGLEKDGTRAARDLEDGSIVAHAVFLQP